MEEIRDNKKVLEIEGDMPIKEEKHSNSEFQSLTSNPTQSPGPPRLQIDVQDVSNL
jgi:hypothetical protein